MRLNLDIIQHRLPQAFQAKRLGPGDRACPFTQPLLYEGGEPLLAGELYVARSELLPRTLPPKSCGIIAVGTRVPREWILDNVPLLVIAGSDSTVSVLNAVQKIVAQLDRWEQRLRDALEKDLDFDIKEILRLGTELLRREICVVDHTLQPLYYSTIQPSADGKTRISVSEESLSMSVEYNEQIKNICRLERVITVPYTTALVSETGCSYCYNLYPMGQFAGCISIGESNRPFREDEYPLMDVFFSFFQKAFLKHLRTYGQTENLTVTALRKLFRHESLLPEEQELLAVHPGEAWVCFKLRERRGEKSLPPEYMYAMLNTLLPKTVCAVLQHNEVVGLLRLQKAENPPDLRDPFSQLLRRMGYYGGVSNPFTDLNYLDDYLLQAAYSVENSRENDRDVHFFRDHVLDYMLFSCAGELRPETMFSQGFRALIEHDRRKSGAYIKTLDTYLRNEMSVTKTAQELYIHRSSLLKRLDSIQRLLGDDLTNPERRLYYRLCLALLQKRAHKFIKKVLSWYALPEKPTIGHFPNFRI